MRKAHQLIVDYYGIRRAERSGVLLVNHIDEGLIILDYLKATDIVKDAYCLHPILQSDVDFNHNKSLKFDEVPTESIILCMEYRRVANSYLSADNIKDFVGISCEEIRQMLIADKVQNYKDFLIYHSKTHEFRKRLDKYFNNWFKLLGISYDTVVNECKLIR